jgi:hypothetical protein
VFSGFKNKLILSKLKGSIPSLGIIGKKAIVLSGTTRFSS